MDPFPNTSNPMSVIPLCQHQTARCINPSPPFTKLHIRIQFQIQTLTLITTIKIPNPAQENSITAPKPSQKPHSSNLTPRTHSQNRHHLQPIHTTITSPSTFADQKQRNQNR
ncbi:hypothetical protein M758_11G096900 [Ceratodon purpureus]|nr:hypothetical protein M758_11G096900 [Ceratodon purpureus]